MNTGFGYSIKIWSDATSQVHQSPLLDTLQSLLGVSVQQRSSTRHVDIKGSDSLIESGMSISSPLLQAPRSSSQDRSDILAPGSPADHSNSHLISPHNFLGISINSGPSLKEAMGNLISSYEDGAKVSVLNQETKKWAKSTLDSPSGPKIFDDFIWRPEKKHPNPLGSHSVNATAELPATSGPARRDYNNASSDSGSVQKDSNSEKIDVSNQKNKSSTVRPSTAKKNENSLSSVNNPGQGKASRTRNKLQKAPPVSDRSNVLGLGRKAVREKTQEPVPAQASDSLKSRLTASFRDLFAGYKNTRV